MMSNKIGMNNMMNNNIGMNNFMNMLNQIINNQMEVDKKEIKNQRTNYNIISLL